MQVLVWRYGARKGAEIPEEVDRQLRLAHELREELVAIAHRREQAVERVWAEHPAVSDAQRELARADAALERLLEQASEERMRRRERKVSRELREQITTARRARRQAKQRERTAKGDPYASVTPALHGARDVERAERKATYREFVQRQGLYWATYNAVARGHDTAARRVAQLRKEGRPAKLHHHHYEGTGRIAVQVHRRSGQQPRIPSLLASPESPWRGVLDLPEVAAGDPGAWKEMSRSKQRKAGRTTIALRIGSHPDRTPIMWEIPIQAHRPIPPDAEVVSAEAVVTRVAGKRRVSVNLAVRIPFSKAAEGPPVAVDIGWRAMPDGSLRVAYWRGAARRSQSFGCRRAGDPSVRSACAAVSREEPLD